MTSFWRKSNEAHGTHVELVCGCSRLTLVCDWLTINQLSTFVGVTCNGIPFLQTRGHFLLCDVIRSVSYETNYSVKSGMILKAVL